RFGFMFMASPHVFTLHMTLRAGTEYPILIEQSSVVQRTVESEPEAVNLIAKIPNRVRSYVQETTGFDTKTGSPSPAHAGHARRRADHSYAREAFRRDHRPGCARRGRRQPLDVLHAFP